MSKWCGHHSDIYSDESKPLVFLLELSLKVGMREWVCKHYKLHTHENTLHSDPMLTYVYMQNNLVHDFLSIKLHTGLYTKYCDYYVIHNYHEIPYSLSSRSFLYKVLVWSVTEIWIT